jgi:hypothetical protein
VTVLLAVRQLRSRVRLTGFNTAAEARVIVRVVDPVDPVPDRVMAGLALQVAPDGRPEQVKVLIWPLKPFTEAADRSKVPVVLPDGMVTTGFADDK